MWGDMNELFVALCDWCIDAMVYFSRVSGISYSAINIILFVMLGPLSTVIFAVAWLLSYFGKRRASVALGIVGALIALAVLAVSVYSLLMTLA